MRTAFRAAFVLSLACGLAAADPIDFGVWTSARIFTGGLAPAPAPNTQIDNNAASGSATGVSTAFFSDEGAALDVNREFFAQAEADLGLGELRLLSDGQGGAAGLAGNASVIAGAMFVDTLTFGASGAVTFSAALDGEFDILETGGGTSAFINFKATVVPASFVVDTADLTTINSVAALFGAMDAVELADEFTTDFAMDEGFNERLLNGSFNAVAGQGYKFLLFAQIGVLNASTTNAWTADFLNTGTLSFDFGGLPVSSASGAFPLGATTGPGGGSGPSAPVPEPGSLALCGAGLAVLWVRRRRIS